MGSLSWADWVVKLVTPLRTKLEEQVEEIYREELVQLRGFAEVFQKELARSEELARRKTLFDKNDINQEVDKAKGGVDDDHTSASPTALDLQVLNLQVLAAAERCVAGERPVAGGRNVQGTASPSSTSTEEKLSAVDVHDLEFLRNAARYMSCAHEAYHYKHSEEDEQEVDPKVESSAKAFAKRISSSAQQLLLRRGENSNKEHAAGGNPHVKNGNTTPNPRPKTFDRILLSVAENFTTPTSASTSTAPPRRIARPEILVGTDEEREAIVVSIRGTASLDDLITDIMVATRTVSLPDLGTLGVAGEFSFHGGMFNSAVYVLDQAHQIVEANLGDGTSTPLMYNPEEGPGRYQYRRIVFTGHSLGGGVAQIAALLFTQMSSDVPALRHTEVECWSYAGPPVVRSSGGVVPVETLEQVFAGTQILDTWQRLRNRDRDRPGATTAEVATSSHDPGHDDPAPEDTLRHDVEDDGTTTLRHDVDDDTDGTTPTQPVRRLDFSGVKRLRAYPFVLERDLVPFVSVGSIMRLLLTLKKIENLQWSALEKLQFILQVERMRSRDRGQGQKDVADGALLSTKRLSDAVETARRLEQLWENRAAPSSAAGSPSPRGRAENRFLKETDLEPSDELRRTARELVQERTPVRADCLQHVVSTQTGSACYYQLVAGGAGSPMHGSRKSRQQVGAEDGAEQGEQSASSRAGTGVVEGGDGASAELGGRREGAEQDEERDFIFHAASPTVVSEVRACPLGFETLPVGFGNAGGSDVALVLRRGVETHRAASYEAALHEAVKRERTRRAAAKLERETIPAQAATTINGTTLDDEGPDEAKEVLPNGYFLQEEGSLSSWSAEMNSTREDDLGESSEILPSGYFLQGEGSWSAVETNSPQPDDHRFVSTDHSGGTSSTLEDAAGIVPDGDLSEHRHDEDADSAADEVDESGYREQHVEQPQQHKFPSAMRRKSALQSSKRTETRDEQETSLTEMASSFTGRSRETVSRLPLRLGLKVVPWGVVGSGGSKHPGSSTVIVDPAGLSFIKGDAPVGKAGGASGAIYKFLGEQAVKDAFQSDVRHHVKKAGHARFYKYGKTSHPASHHHGQSSPEDWTDITQRLKDGDTFRKVWDTLTEFVKHWLDTDDCDAKLNRMTKHECKKEEDLRKHFVAQMKQKGENAGGEDSCWEELLPHLREHKNSEHFNWGNTKKKHLCQKDYECTKDEGSAIHKCRLQISPKDWTDITQSLKDDDNFPKVWDKLTEFVKHWHDNAHDCDAKLKGMTKDECKNDEELKEHFAKQMKQEAGEVDVDSLCWESLLPHLHDHRTSGKFTWGVTKRKHLCKTGYECTKDESSAIHKCRLPQDWTDITQRLTDIDTLPKVWDTLTNFVNYWHDNAHDCDAKLKGMTKHECRNDEELKEHFAAQMKQEAGDVDEDSPCWESLLPHLHDHRTSENFHWGETKRRHLCKRDYECTKDESSAIHKCRRQRGHHGGPAPTVDDPDQLLIEAHTTSPAASDTGVEPNTSPAASDTTTFVIKDAEFHERQL
eukprot:g5960.t1